MEITQRSEIRETDLSDQDPQPASDNAWLRTATSLKLTASATLTPDKLRVEVDGTAQTHNGSPVMMALANIGAATAAVGTGFGMHAVNAPAAVVWGLPCFIIVAAITVSVGWFITGFRWPNRR